MSSFVTTFLVPVLIVLALRLFPVREALKWSWLTLVPDLDYFTYNNQIPGIPNLHRGLLHNVVILLALAGLFLWQYSKWRGVHPGQSLVAYVQTSRGALWGLATYYYFAHITLDLFAGGIVPFFPFNTWTLAYDFRILVDTNTNRPDLTQGPSTSDQVPQVSPLFEWLSNEESAMVLLMGVSLVLWWLRRRTMEDVTVVRAREVARPPPHP